MQDSGTRYDAFISYSRKLDGDLARDLLPGLERFALPWYRRRRALRVFRDDASLSANPGLWGSIKEALEASEWLILLASPEAACSEWINREVQWWLENKPNPLDRLLIAVTEGQPTWEAGPPSVDEESSDVLPVALRGRYAAEPPRWVDLRSVRIRSHDGGHRTGLQEALADLASPLLGKPKDLLYGDTIRQYRRNMRWAYRAVAVLTVLTLLAVLAGVFAYVQRNQARTDARIALSRQVVAEAAAIQATTPGLARQLLVAADRIDPTDQVVGALLNSLSIPGQVDLRSPVLAEAYSPRGPVLAVGTDTGLVLYDTATGSRLATLTRRNGSIFAVAFSHDGNILAAAGQHMPVHFWDVADSAHPRLLTESIPSAESINALAFSANGDMLATVSVDDTVRLWDMTAPTHPTIVTTLRGNPSAVGVLALSPDGMTLARGGINNTVQLWNISDPTRPTRLATLTGSIGAVDVLAFSPDGHLLASGGQTDATVRVWDVTNPAHPLARPTLSGHAEPVDALAFSPNGNMLATGSLDDTVRLWDITDPTHPTILSTLSGHSSTVSAIAFSPDGLVVAAGSQDQTVFIWNVTDPVRSVAISALAGSSYPAAFSPDGRIVASGDPIELSDITNPSSPRVLATLVTGHGIVQAAAFSPDGHVLAAESIDGSTRLWDVTDPAHPKDLMRLTGRGGAVAMLAFSLDGHTLASTNGDAPRLWNVTNASRPTAIVSPSTEFTTTDAFSAQSRTLTAADLVGWSNVIDPAAPSSFATWAAEHGHTHVLALSPDGHIMATASGDRTLHLWDISDPASPVALTTLTGAAGAFQVVTFSPDGRTLAAGTLTGNVSLWDISDPTHPAALTTLTANSSTIQAVAFSPDGHFLATTGLNGTVQLWDMDITDILQRLCVESSQPITQAQWDQYIPGVAYARPCLAGAHLRMPTGTGVSMPATRIPAATIPASPRGTVPGNVAAKNLHHVDWANVSIPGQFCSVPGFVKLKGGQATSFSTKWGSVRFSEIGPVIYGDLGGAGQEEGAVSVWCDNGGGTADSELAQAYLIFDGAGGKLTAIGAITAQEQPGDVHVSNVTKVTFSPDRIAAHEVWYRGSDPSCCPSGTAVTIWTYTHGQLVPGTPDIRS